MKTFESTINLQLGAEKGANSINQVKKLCKNRVNYHGPQEPETVYESDKFTLEQIPEQLKALGLNTKKVVRIMEDIQNQIKENDLNFENAGKGSTFHGYPNMISRGAFNLVVRDKPENPENVIIQFIILRVKEAVPN